MKLQFKKIGYFADENSARYEAIVNEHFKVRVFKDFYMKGFRYEFLTNDGYDLDSLNGDLLSTFWNKATKKEAINEVTNILLDKKLFSEIEKKAIYVTNLMSEYLIKNK
jgi:hypothetical protein